MGSCYLQTTTGRDDDRNTPCHKYPIPSRHLVTVVLSCLRVAALFGMPRDGRTHKRMLWLVRTLVMAATATYITAMKSNADSGFIPLKRPPKGMEVLIRGM